MKSTRSLRRQLRALWIANALLVAAVCVAATPAVRPLFLDTSNHPTAYVDFGDNHWTGTLDPARLPASAPLLDGSLNLALTGNLTASGYLSTDGGALYSDGGGDVTLWSFSAANGAIHSDSQGNLYFSAGFVNGSLSATGPVISSQGFSVANGTPSIDESGTIYYPNGMTLAAGDCLYAPYDSDILADSYGNLYSCGNLVSDGSCLYGPEGMGLWGANPPYNQPATPTDLAGVIAVLQAYGLCQ